MTVRQHYVQQALQSFSELTAILPQLNEEEVIACLELESASMRRPTVITRLIARATRINEQRYAQQLKEKYHAP